MPETPSCYDITVTVNRDGGYRPDPAEFAAAAGQAASARIAGVMSAHTAGKIISIVTFRPQTGPLPSPWPWQWCLKRSDVRPRRPSAERTVVVSHDPGPALAAGFARAVAAAAAAAVIMITPAGAVTTQHMSAHHFAVHSCHCQWA